MGKNPEQLNQKQVDVLGWISDGCPAGVYEDGHEHKITAQALQRRGLIKIKGRGPTWTAAITAAGRRWIADPPAVVLPDETEADRLIAQVLDAGGRLVVHGEGDVVAANERLVRMSLKSASRPRGKKLSMSWVGRYGRGPIAIELVEHFDDLVDAVPVPVPERIGKYHPAVRAYVSDKEWHYVTPDHVPRAARILQALAREAERRGMDAWHPASALKGRPPHEVGKVRKLHLAVQTPAGEYTIQVKEIAGPGAAQLGRSWERGRKPVPAWIDTRNWEFISTGKLELVVHGQGFGYDGAHYRDAKSTKVEDRLPELLRAFEVQRLRAEWQEQERKREEADRRRRWESAMDSAKEKYVEHAKWEHFIERSQEWHAINRHRAFLEAVRDELDRYVGEDRVAIEQHLVEVESALDMRDPLRSLERMV
ncbi:MAG: hypothetical protein ACRDPS_09545 [Nocardioides sp.]|uniref:hypothetical protein n=1 Tax=Nocardioides sp. TaxID=35761 RepID=UPI003D6B193D